MKAEIFTLSNDQLAFSFWKRDVKTDEDKKAICAMIDHLYHVHCVESLTDIEHLDELLSGASKWAGVVITVMPEDDSVSLVVMRKTRK